MSAESICNPQENVTFRHDDKFWDAEMVNHGICFKLLKANDDFVHFVLVNAMKKVQISYP